jgi:hypothetical protein
LLRDAEAVTDVLRMLEAIPGRVAEVVRREAAATLAALAGRRVEATAAFIDALRRWRDLGVAFDASLCTLSMVSLLGAAEPETRAAANEARAVFERLGAVPLLRQLEAAMEQKVVPPTDTDRASRSTSNEGVPERL